MSIWASHKYIKASIVGQNTKAMKNQHSNQVIRIPSSLAVLLLDRSMKRNLTDGRSNESSEIGQRKQNSRVTKTNKLGFKMDNFAKGILEHVRLAPKLTESMKGKLSLLARILQVGGVDNVFKQLFSVGNGEKLLKASQCYLSTTAGPIAGLLFISTDKIAFCSERLIKFLSPTGKLLRIYYKVLIPLEKIKRANTSENVKKPSQKYIQLVTDNKFEFWFMGFVNHEKTLQYIQKVLYQDH